MITRTATAVTCWLLRPRIFGSVMAGCAAFAFSGNPWGSAFLAGAIPPLLAVIRGQDDDQ